MPVKGGGIGTAGGHKLYVYAGDLAKGWYIGTNNVVFTISKWVELKAESPFIVRLEV